jgi:anthranilate synthase component 1
MDINPNINQFIKLAKKHNLIVLSHKFYCDWLTPVSIYARLRKRFKGESFLLESVEGEEKVSRFSFLGFSPLQTFRSKGRTINLSGVHTRIFQTAQDPIYELKELMSRFSVAPLENLRFFGGFVGYAGYDIARFYEPIGKELPDKAGLADTYFILPKFLIIFDHVKRQIEILSFAAIGEKKNIRRIYAREKQNLIKLFEDIAASPGLPPLKFCLKKIGIRSNFRKKEFMRAVEKIKSHIRRGDIIQAVPSQQFSADFDAEPFEVYRYLRILNPSPYMFFLDFKGVTVAGSSPEMLLRCEKNELVTHPIAGTRPRGANEAEDIALEKDLLTDTKEIAEHIMLVDLARNDLGRVAEKATVIAPRFKYVERFSHVMHIVSEVRAKLAKNKDIFSAFISCFPAGTLSGAPKVRAMQIINDIEPQARGLYGGSIGYFSFTNSMDTCIIIRTILFNNGKAYIQAGAGIVNDSRPEKEYKETVNKARAQILALQYAQG